MTCDSEFKYGSKCYKLCPDGYSQMVAHVSDLVTH